MVGLRFIRVPVAALAIVALAFVLLGRVCSAGNDHTVGHDQAQAVCCVMIEEASATAVSHAPAFKPVPLFVWRVAPRPALVASAPSARVLAYHVRSARILS